MKSHSLQLQELVVGREGIPFTGAICRHVKSGEMLVVQGANGSGKSTLLKILVGLRKPLSGKVVLHGEWPQTPPLYLAHQLGLWGSLSVLDNVAFWAKAARCPELIPAALRYFDLETLAQAAVETLSAGWQRRVALTRLITMPSLLWVLDEPTTHLDHDGLQLLETLIQSRRERGGIVMIASHHAIRGEGITTVVLSPAESARGNTP